MTDERAVNEDNFRFLDGLRRTYGAYADKVAICGLMRCRGDAYNPAERLSEDDARVFHAWQAQKLTEASEDFLLASTLPALSEATGIASAQAATGKPYIISFVFHPDGTLLDGTPLKDAVSTIDAKINPRPLAYMCNCTHASIFRSALTHKTHVSSCARKRIIMTINDARSANNARKRKCRPTGQMTINDARSANDARRANGSRFIGRIVPQ